MPKGLLIGADHHVATWAFDTYDRFPMHINKAFGVIEDDRLVGAAIFSDYNSMNVQFSYYGKNALSVGIVRALARFCIDELNLSRCTVIVPKRPSYLLKKLPKFGFRFEGIQKRFYGHTEAPRHTGCRFVLFREDIEKLAALRVKKVA